jgi:cupin superfamily acireductone dioxygenase involved in methionine salvage
MQKRSIGAEDAQDLTKHSTEDGEIWFVKTGKGIGEVHTNRGGADTLLKSGDYVVMKMEVRRLRRLRTEGLTDDEI